MGDQTLLKRLFFNGFYQFSPFVAQHLRNFPHRLRNIWGIFPHLLHNKWPFVAQQINPARHTQLLLNSISSISLVIQESIKSRLAHMFQRERLKKNKTNINIGFCFTHTHILKNHHFCFFLATGKIFWRNYCWKRNKKHHFTFFGFTYIHKSIMGVFLFFFHLSQRTTPSEAIEWTRTFNDFQHDHQHY